MADQEWEQEPEPYEEPEPQPEPEPEPEPEPYMEQQAGVCGVEWCLPELLLLGCEARAICSVVNLRVTLA